MTAWESWLGRTEDRREWIDSTVHARWLAALDRAPPADGSIAQGYHWCVCLPDAPTALLGNDGHPEREGNRDSFLPPTAQPRRMWFASKVAFLATVWPDCMLSRTSRITSIREKTGRSGSLLFVEVAHELRADDRPCIREMQSIVFRDPPPGDAVDGGGQHAALPFDGSAWDAHRVITPREPLLFRYSALTFNSHRIHYDLPYATEEEGYRGLVVQGPLTATLLLDLARRQLGDNRLRSFDFRGVSPAICGDDLHLVMRRNDQGLELGAFSADGREIMIAEARL